MTNQKKPISVNVMMPLDTLCVETVKFEVKNTVKDMDTLAKQLIALKKAGVTGVMIDIWWGLVESQPKQYDFSGYKKVFELIQSQNLKVQPVFSFHQCGGYPGDSVTVNLPDFVVQAARKHRLFCESHDKQVEEYLSPSANDQEVFGGRTAFQLYKDFITAFKDEFRAFESIIDVIFIGAGPCGELRYPSYSAVLTQKDEFMCFDPLMQQKLKKQGIDLWLLQQEQKFNPNELTAVNGFMDAYEYILLEHAVNLIHQYRQVFPTHQLAIKIAGIHWKWQKHEAEHAAGYYYLESRNFYAKLAKMLSDHGVALCYTCAERLNDDFEHKDESNPEKLAQTVVQACKTYKCKLILENAEESYGRAHLDKFIKSAHDGKPETIAVTFLRLTEKMFKKSNWFEFQEFIKYVNDNGNYVLSAQLGSLLCILLIGLIFYVVDRIIKSKK